MESLPDAVIGHLRETITVPDFSGTRYELLGEIGRGGMGTVYAGLDKQLNRRVAIKILNVIDYDGQAAERITEEARTLARLEHPGIVPVHDLGELPDGRFYYAMKLVEGTPLDRYVAAHTGLAEILRVFMRICETVAFAHSHGITHRDLKPQNMMVGPFGEVLVMDWGVAKITGTTREFPKTNHPRGATAQGTAIGTPGYMAPEQMAGTTDEVDQRSDIYSLGKTLETMLLSSGGQVPRRLRAIWEKAAAHGRAHRYASVEELSTDIERFRSGEPVSAYRETVVERMGRVLAKNRALALLVAAYLVMRVVLLFLLHR